MVPTPAASGAAPNRQAFTPAQARSSAGSPTWASSQSMTARSPSRPTITFPSRRSPCTTTRPRRAGRLRASHWRAVSNVGLTSSTSPYISSR
jgi:hypothetical protein